MKGFAGLCQTLRGFLLVEPPVGASAVAVVKGPAAVRDVHVLCGWCHRVCDRGDRWVPLEEYLGTHSEATFARGVCPKCLRHAAEPSLQTQTA